MGSGRLPRRATDAIVMLLGIRPLQASYAAHVCPCCGVSRFEWPREPDPDAIATPPMLIEAISGSLLVSPQAIDRFWLSVFSITAVAAFRITSRTKSG